MYKKKLNRLTESFSQIDQKSFIQTLNALIRMYGITDLTKDSGINRISLWRYMRGEQDIKVTSFAKLMKTLGIVVHFEAGDDLRRAIHYLRWQKANNADLELVFGDGKNPKGETDDLM